MDAFPSFLAQSKIATVTQYYKPHYLKRYFKDGGALVSILLHQKLIRLTSNSHPFKDGKQKTPFIVENNRSHLAIQIVVSK